MSDLEINGDRVLNFAGSICDEIATDGDFAEMDTILLTDQQSRNEYLDYCWLHVALKSQLRVRAAAQKAHQQISIELGAAVPGKFNVATDASSSLMPPAVISTTFHGTLGYFSSGWPLAYLVAMVILGIGLIIGAITHVSYPGKSVASGQRPLTAETSSQSPIVNPSIVGRVTGMVDCNFTDPSTLTFSGAYVSAGRRYAISSGLMEITYNTGAKVILQGPVTYEAESKNGGFMSVGRLTGKVEVDKAKGFAVRTPTAVVTDLGTEFGVEVSKEGITTSHVFQGSIEIQARAVNGNSQGAVRILRENECASVELTGNNEETVVRSTTFNPAIFVRTEHFFQRMKESNDKRQNKSFENWLAYSRQIRRDPSLVAYYDFQRKQDSPSVLLNAAGNGDHSLDGVIEKASWCSGRFPGKDAVRFVAAKDRIRVNMPGQFDALTMAAWVRMEGCNPLRGILMTDGWSRLGQIHWQLTLDGQYAFAMSGGPCYYSAPMPPSDSHNVWRHLATVVDMKVPAVTFYVDGCKVGKEKIQHVLPMIIGAAQIGSYSPEPQGSDSDLRSFLGRIDELMIFNRPLSDTEIQHVYEMKNE